ncbi:hypothetical protein PENSUB_5408 [Penicillium subrubescens]|uniref:Uncharacterized protein n=2 Tax=Penicillium subrubescens TaxID=1316194 RepID=A0A1Q5U9U9_9EURO|nr:hypothetical protein PENSUB_5410 [Penicillium subrubescens]OKP09249.1 hypothetical protein PENSUB_5408 [Penicillium subrubescens]
MSATLAGLFWADKAPVGREVLLQMSAIPPTLQMTTWGWHFGIGGWLAKR